MKELWVEIESKASAAERDSLLKLAAEVGDATLEGAEAHTRLAKGVISVLNSLDEGKVAKLKRSNQKVALRINIGGKADENTAVKAAELGVDYIILNCLDWRVIPLENLIARASGKSKLIAEVKNAEDAKLVLEALELGTDGVLLKTADAAELTKTAAVVKKQTPRIALTQAKVTAVKQIDIGARVCVDTCDLMTTGEGLLVGCQSAGLFLVEAEVYENPYVQSRPFRVNAGAPSMYTLASLQNTRYLSELKAGDDVLIVTREGKVRRTNVGRAKIEFRPLLLVEAEAEGSKVKVILQNAETIRLVTAEGSKPVSELKAGDEVLVHMAARGGRHFGVSVADERVIEH
ncbi:MAG: 3-dehydroquinate synthase II [Candidatus Bathyarchaeota archaeon]|nr:3-dehydroquinate synthase II [Candidatus Bathyarchaeota archaeon]